MRWRLLLSYAPDHLRVTMQREWQLAILALGGLAPGVAVLLAWLNLAWRLRSDIGQTEPEAGWMLPPFLLDQLGAAGVLVGAGLVTLLIGCLGLANAYLMSVERRLPDLALLHSLGLRRREVMALLWLESATAGLLGSSVGLLLGLFLSQATWPSGRTYFAIAGSYRLEPVALAAAFVTGLIAAFLFMGTTAIAGVAIEPMRLLRGERPPLPLHRWQEWETATYGTIYAGLLVLVAGAPILHLQALVTLLILTVGLSAFLTVGGWFLANHYGRLPAPRQAILWRMALRGLTRHPRHTAGLSLSMIAGAYGVGLAALAVAADPGGVFFPAWVAGGVLVAGAGLVLTAAALAALERRRELALLVALGSRPSRVQRMILLEYGIVALGGGTLGALLALVNWAMAGAGNWWMALGIGLLDVLAALLSAWVGAAPVLWRVARRSPGQELRDRN